MFTGIVEEIGQLVTIKKTGTALQLTIMSKVVYTDAHLGDSIAVNGVCLTITRIDGQHLHFDVVPETFRKSSLSVLKVGAYVNLERAMAANGRYGGHLVSGHVDTVGTLQKITKENNAYVITIQVDAKDMLKYMVDRGSVTLDGISLTINRVLESKLSVSIIPHTYESTTMSLKKVGDPINIEVDMIAKYVERLLHFPQQTQASHLSKEYLSEHGFLGGWR
jgi:riboflavin synthase